MEIDQLKIILEMVKTISGDASSVVIVYMIAQFLMSPLKLVIGFFGLFKIVQLVMVSISKHSEKS